LDINVISIADKSVGAISKVIEDLEGDCTTIIMSDHGMTPSYSVFHLNRWLKEVGLLKNTVTRTYMKKRINGLSRRRPSFGDSRLQSLAIDITQKVSDYLPKQLKEMVKRYIMSLVTGKGGRLDVDWDLSFAIACNYQQIKFMHREGTREQKAAEDFLIRELCSVKDPKTGLPIVDKMYRRDKIYSGPNTKYAPLISVTSKDKHCLLSTHHSPGPIYNTNRSGTTGIHELDGVIIMQGDGIKKGARITGASILDVAPTVLYALELPIISDMDGEVLISAYTQSYKRSHLVKKTDVSDARRSSGKKREGEHGDVVYTEEEKQDIQDMLHELGYIG